MRFLPVLFTGGVAGVIRVLPSNARPRVGDWVKCDDGRFRQVKEYATMGGFVTFAAASAHARHRYVECFDSLAVAGDMG